MLHLPHSAIDIGHPCMKNAATEWARAIRGRINHYVFSGKHHVRQVDERLVDIDHFGATVSSAQRLAGQQVRCRAPRHRTQLAASSIAFEMQPIAASGPS